MFTLHRRNIFMREKLILCSGRMLYKDYKRRRSVAKKKLVIIVKRLDAKMN
jgi:hypothetical protein